MHLFLKCKLESLSRLEEVLGFEDIYCAAAHPRMLSDPMLPAAWDCFELSDKCCSPAPAISAELKAT